MVYRRKFYKGKDFSIVHGRGPLTSTALETFLPRMDGIATPDVDEDLTALLIYQRRDLLASDAPFSHNSYQHFTCGRDISREDRKPESYTL